MARSDTDADLLRLQLEHTHQLRYYSYQLIQQLTFFIIGIEIVACGYLVLNADTLGKISGSNNLFLASGCAAFFGLLWRTAYNAGIYNNMHGIIINKVMEKTINICYHLYVILSVVFFIGAIAIGYCYLSSI